MPTIDTDQGLSPAALFMENAGTDLNRVTNFILKVIERSLKLGEAAKPPSSTRSTSTSAIPTARSRSSCRSTSPSTRRCGGRLHPAAAGLAVRRRVVGQLYCSRDGKSLQLEIKARPDARDMGNAVLALSPLKFNVHTPLSSAQAETSH